MSHDDDWIVQNSPQRNLEILEEVDTYLKETLRAMRFNMYTHFEQTWEYWARGHDMQDPYYSGIADDHDLTPSYPRTWSTEQMRRWNEDMDSCFVRPDKNLDTMNEIVEDGIAILVALEDAMTEVKKSQEERLASLESGSKDKEVNKQSEEHAPSNKNEGLRHAAEKRSC